MIEDLLEAATDIFGEDVDLALEGIRGVVAYLKSGKAQNVLVKMAPETREVVETLVEELEL